jgi:cystathionine beta-lyase
MSYNFDEIIPRYDTDSMKWNLFEKGVTPMWVADMDFRSPESVSQALKTRAEQGMFGYIFDSTSLREVICERLMRLYQWAVKPEQIVFVPGLVTGMNLVCRSIGQPGDGVIMLTPAYPPFLFTPRNNSRFAQFVQMPVRQEGQFLRYDIDFGAIEAAITSQTKLYLQCNPHNPVGRVYTRAELERFAEICLRHNLTICSDEIHSDLLLNGSRHIPMATLSPEIAEKTITLMAPSKTFNLPGLYTGFAIVPNEELRHTLEAAAFQAGHVSIFGFAAAEAAYRNGQAWLDEVLAYLQGNYHALVKFLQDCLPDVAMAKMEGTYLAWLDVRNTGISLKTNDEYMNKRRLGLNDFFLTRAKVALSVGEGFGRGGEGFLRMNFACPRPLLMDVLERMRAALESR